MNGGAYREGLDGLRLRLDEAMASLEGRATAFGPLRRALLGDGDRLLRQVEELRTETAGASTVDDGARLLELLQRIEGAAAALEASIDSSTRALAARPPLPDDVAPRAAPNVHQHHDWLDVVGQRVLLHEAILGEASTARRFSGQLVASVPLRLPHFHVKSRDTIGAVVSFFRSQVIDHPAFDHRYAIEGDVAVARLLLGEEACDALVGIPLPVVALRVADGILRLACSDGSPTRGATAKMPPTALRALTAILSRIEEEA